MPVVTETRPAPDLSRPPEWFEDAAREDHPDANYYWTTFGKLHEGPRGERLAKHTRHLRIYRHSEDAEVGAREPRPFWTWDGLPAFHITVPQAMALARRGGYAGVVLQERRDGEWIDLKTWEA